MTTEERKAFENELYVITKEYSLTDKSAENLARRERIRELRALLEKKPDQRKKTWLSSDCRKYAKHLI